VIETEQSAEPVATNDATGPLHVLLFTVDQSVPQPLMVPLAMVVRHVLGDGMSQMSLAQWHDPLQALALDRKHESLRICVQIRTSAGSMPFSRRIRWIVLRPIL